MQRLHVTIEHVRTVRVGLKKSVLGHDMCPSTVQCAHALTTCNFQNVVFVKIQSMLVLVGNALVKIKEYIAQTC